MAIVANWWNSLGLRLKLQILIQGFLILVLLAAQQWVLVQFEKQVLHGATDRARAAAPMRWRSAASNFSRICEINLGVMRLSPKAFSA